MWHSSPDHYQADVMHPMIANKTHGEVYAKTLAREQLIRDNGFNLEGQVGKRFKGCEASAEDVAKMEEDPKHRSA